MNFAVHIAADAEDDLFDIYCYVRTADCASKADYVFGKLQDACESLSHMPERGHTPPELSRVGVREYREIHFKPYRIIYRIAERTVFVHCVLDGRRDLQELLEQRLLR